MGAAPLVGKSTPTSKEEKKQKAISEHRRAALNPCKGHQAYKDEVWNECHDQDGMKSVWVGHHGKDVMELGRWARVAPLSLPNHFHKCGKRGEGNKEKQICVFIGRHEGG